MTIKPLNWTAWNSVEQADGVDGYRYTVFLDQLAIRLAHVHGDRDVRVCRDNQEAKQLAFEHHCKRVMKYLEGE
jgi:hypothetical protein